MGCTSSSPARVNPATTEHYVAPQKDEGEGQCWATSADPKHGVEEGSDVPPGKRRNQDREKTRKHSPSDPHRAVASRHDQLGRLFAGVGGGAAHLQSGQNNNSRLGPRRSSLSNVMSRGLGQSGHPLFRRLRGAAHQGQDEEGEGEEEEEEERRGDTANEESARKHNQEMGQKLEQALAKTGKQATKPVSSARRPSGTLLEQPHNHPGGQDARSGDIGVAAAGSRMDRRTSSVGQLVLKVGIATGRVSERDLLANAQEMNAAGRDREEGGAAPAPPPPQAPPGSVPDTAESLRTHAAAGGGMMSASFPVMGTRRASLDPRAMLALTRGPHVGAGANNSRSANASPLPLRRPVEGSSSGGGDGPGTAEKEDADTGSMRMEMVGRSDSNSTVDSAGLRGGGQALLSQAQRLTRRLSLQPAALSSYLQQRGNNNSQEQSPPQQQQQQSVSPNLVSGHQQQGPSRSQPSSPMQGRPGNRGVFTPTLGGGATSSLLQVPSRAMRAPSVGSELSRRSSPHFMGPSTRTSSPPPPPPPPPPQPADAAPGQLGVEQRPSGSSNERPGSKREAYSFRSFALGRAAVTSGRSGMPSLAAGGAAAAAAAASSSRSFNSQRHATETQESSSSSDEEDGSDQVEVLSLRQANVVRVFGPPVEAYSREEWRSKKRIVRRWLRSVQRPPIEELLQGFVETEEELQAMREAAEREGVSVADATGRSYRHSSLALQKQPPPQAATSSSSPSSDHQ